MKEECATCRLVVPVLAELARGPGPLTVYTQDDPAPSRAGRHATTPTSPLSWHHDIETVPTLIRVVDGVEVERTVGWDRGRVGGADRP